MAFELIEVSGDEFTIDVDMGATMNFGYYEVSSSHAKGSLKFTFEPKFGDQSTSLVEITVAEVFKPKLVQIPKPQLTALSFLL